MPLRVLNNPRERVCRECKKPFTAWHYQQLDCGKQCHRKWRRRLYWTPTDHVPLDLPRRNGFVGAASELLVCVDLLKKGLHAFRAQNPYCPYDLICTDQESFWTIEVKTGKRVRSNENGERVGFSKGKIPTKANPSGDWQKNLHILALPILETMEVYYFRPGGSIYQTSQRLEFWKKEDEEMPMIDAAYAEQAHHTPEQEQFGDN